MSLQKSMFSLTFLLIVGLVACAQPEHKLSPHDTVTAANLKVTYGRPYKKGREIFGGLAPYGKVYRCGADEATTITFAKDATFVGKPVKAGTYALYVIPNPTQWTIILNGVPNQWGTEYADHKDKDVLHVDVPVTNLGASVEQLTITAPGNGLTIAWDKTKVAIPISF